MTRKDLSDIDTVNFFVYGLSQFITGSVGDNFRLDVVMPVTYTVQALCFAGVGVAGLDLYSGQWWYYLMFTLIGVFQCIVFPSFIGVIAAWFPKH